MTEQHDTATSRTILVIGYGNTLRRDDGAGQYVAHAVEAANLAGVSCLAVHQLTPEIAADLATVDTAIFVDAEAGGLSERVRVREVSVGGSRNAVHHVASPEAVLSLCTRAYATTPRAWLVTVPASVLDFGDGLSRHCQTVANDAIRIVLDLIAAASPV